MILRAMASAPKDGRIIGGVHSTGILAIHCDPRTITHLPRLWTITSGGRVDHEDLIGWFDLGEIEAVLKSGWSS